jgi:hypothetical protein
LNIQEQCKSRLESRIKKDGDIYRFNVVTTDTQGMNFRYWQGDSIQDIHNTMIKRGFLNIEDVENMTDIYDLEYINDDAIDATLKENVDLSDVISHADCYYNEIIEINHLDDILRLLSEENQEAWNELQKLFGTDYAKDIENALSVWEFGGTSEQEDSADVISKTIIWLKNNGYFFEEDTESDIKTIGGVLIVNNNNQFEIADEEVFKEINQVHDLIQQGKSIGMEWDFNSLSDENIFKKESIEKIWDSLYLVDSRIKEQYPTLEPMMIGEYQAILSYDKVRTNNKDFVALDIRMSDESDILFGQLEKNVSIHHMGTMIVTEKTYQELLEHKNNIWKETNEFCLQMNGPGEIETRFVTVEKQEEEIEHKLTVEEVKDIARKNYEQGGDAIIECWSDKEIQELIDESKNVEKTLYEMFSVREEQFKAAKYFAGEDVEVGKMKLLVIEPGKEGYVKEIDHTLENLQEVVGGYIQGVSLEPGVEMICNEEGLPLKLEPNRRVVANMWNYQLDTIIHGTFCVVGMGGDDYCSLSDEKIKEYTEKFGKSMESAMQEQVNQAVLRNEFDISKEEWNSIDDGEER